MSTSTNLQIRVVFGSNLYVAAALRPGQYADRWLDIATMPGSSLKLFVSPYILSEVQRKLLDRFDFKMEDVAQLVKRIEICAAVVLPKRKRNVVLDDPDDNAIIACAIEARAHLIITADNHLLKLNPYEGIGIAHPRELKNIFAADYKKL